MDTLLWQVARQYRRDARAVMRVGDRVGPNDTELANVLYAASARLQSKAGEMMERAWADDEPAC
ncbi:hypothetical protein Pan2_98 [Pseudanabaena phage Pan2]|nr:hypothetical protein Pan2_98 [Pseudanabaena phage Pan2]